MSSSEPGPSEIEVDYIVVGAGSAGCVVANRLTTDARTRVLLLEAGGKDDWIWFHIPVGYLFAIGNPRADWMFRTESESGLNGRSLAYPRGKVVGGSSAINAMLSLRGQAADYDGWRDLGLPGWGWSDVLPIFRDIEDHFLGASSVHGAGGPWRVELPRVRWAVLDAVANAAAELGIPKTADFNTGDNFGVGYFHVNQRRGVRWSAAKGFLRPVLGRPNLRTELRAEAERIVVKDRRACAVIVRKDRKRFRAVARREIILCAGAIGTPVLLQRSGIGPADLLKQVGVEVIVDRSGVGANLQDHLQLRAIYRVSGVPTLNERYHSVAGRLRMGLEYALRRTGPLTMAPSQLGIFAYSRPGVARPDLEFHVQPLSLDKFGDPLHRFPAITVSACNLRPTSRGYVSINSCDADTPPRIAPNYLSTEDDRVVAADAIRLTRRLMRQQALAPFRPSEHVPGPNVGDDLEELSRAAAAIGTTIFHPVGTARMGLAADSGAVVDNRLRMIGLDGLRVVDASVMPTITSGNTNTPTIMIAAKASEMIAQNR